MGLRTKWGWTRSAPPVAPAAIALVFLIAQLISTAHAAEFGEDDHSHDGVECELVLHADRLDDLDLAASDAVPYPTIVFASAIWPASERNTSNPAISFHARSPPGSGPLPL